MTTEEVSFPHVYLYAKGWYTKSGDMLADLREIISREVSVEPKYISDREIFRIVIDLAVDEIFDGNWNKRHFASKLIRDGVHYAEVGYNDGNALLCMLESAIGILSIAHVKGRLTTEPYADLRRSKGE